MKKLEPKLVYDIWDISRNIENKEDSKLLEDLCSLYFKDNWEAMNLGQHSILDIANDDLEDDQDDNYAKLVKLLDKYIPPSKIHISERVGGPKKFAFKTWYIEYWW